LSKGENDEANRKTTRTAVFDLDSKRKMWTEERESKVMGSLRNSGGGGWGRQE
jgi:hypothetical protein